MQMPSVRPRHGRRVKNESGTAVYIASCTEQVREAFFYKR